MSYFFVHVEHSIKLINYKIQYAGIDVKINKNIIIDETELVFELN